jgi:Protein of unknown function (DUF3759)
MGFFKSSDAQDAYGQVYEERTHHSKWTHELVAGAAGFEAMRMYEHHREREGITEHHEFGKEMIAGFAAAEADKLFEGRGLDHIDRERARRQAEEQAHYLYDQQYQQYYPPQY